MSFYEEALRVRLQPLEWELLNIIISSRCFLSLPFMRKAMELRVLLREIIFLLKKKENWIKLDPAIDLGTYDVLVAAKKCEPQNSSTFQSLIKIDVALEHASDSISDQYWWHSLQVIENCCNSLNFDSVVETSLLLQALATKKSGVGEKDFLLALWWNSEHLIDANRQRQSLLTMFINIVAAELRQQVKSSSALCEAKKLRSSSKGDKEIFKSILMTNTLKRFILKPHPVTTYRERMNALLQVRYLRGRTRHVDKQASEFTLEHLRSELLLLFRFTLELKNPEGLDFMLTQADDRIQTYSP